MKVSGNFFLVGPMGAGKSTIGRQLARALNLEFVDSDKEIETRTGRHLNGTLAAVNPAYTHGFGAPLAALSTIGDELRALLRERGKSP